MKSNKLLNLAAVAATLTLGACANPNRTPVLLRATTAPSIYQSLPSGKRDAFSQGYELGRGDILKSAFWGSGRNPRYPDGGMGDGKGTSDAEPKLQKRLVTVLVPGGTQPDGTIQEPHYVVVESVQ